MQSSALPVPYTPQHSASPVPFTPPRHNGLLAQYTPPGPSYPDRNNLTPLQPRHADKQACTPAIDE